MKFISKVIMKMLQALQFTLWHAPISIAALVGLYFALAVFIDPAKETISIISYAFAIVVALASVSFGYARCHDSAKQKNKMQYCGERFLHSALLFLVASIIKYFLAQDQVQAASHASREIGVVIAFTSFLPGALFLGSLVNSIAALRELNTHLYLQKNPGQELTRFV